MMVEKKIEATLNCLQRKLYETIPTDFIAEYKKTEYKSNNILPTDGFSLYEKNAVIKTEPDRHFWLKIRFFVREISSDYRLFLRFSTGKNGWDSGNPQGLVYMNGEMIQELDVNHRDVSIDSTGEIELYVYFYTGNPLDGTNQFQTDFSLTAVYCDLEKLWYDIRVPYDCSVLLGEGVEKYTILKHLTIACNILDFQTSDAANFRKSVKNALSYLEEEFYKKACNNKKIPTVKCIGHTHIDVAWLWTIKQTAEKAQRSFATAVSLLKEYPEFSFMSSQPQLYEYVKRESPDLYEEIRCLVKKKSWKPEGAMWLEADCNLISGESLIRQIMFGKRFFKNEFGIESKLLWLPDVFGYSAALPQILKKSGIDYFVTSKISWNETNKMPHSSFYWQGIDGTEIFTTFIEGSYSGLLTPKEINDFYVNYRDKAFSNTTISSVGFGDGGGGVTREMLETQRRMARGIPGVPRTVFSNPVEAVESIKVQVDENSKIYGEYPKWVGELYLELHRGTYTSVSKNKRNNRKCEFLLKNAESLASISMIYGGTYDFEILEKCQKTILLNQFHDIIPGSSIAEVYAESDRQYTQVIYDLNSCISELLIKIGEKIIPSDGVCVYNPLGFYADSTAKIDGETVVFKNLAPYSIGYAFPITKNDCSFGEDFFENGFFKITYDKNANITSIYDKQRNREVLCGNGNILEVFEDLPYSWENWEISDYYFLKKNIIDKAELIQRVDDGARAGIKVVRKYFNSTIIQYIWLYNGIDRIDFESEIDWHEQQQLLKARFPLNVLSDKATYEIQFGSVERPTHKNTSWDAAKFEVCAHKWADLSDGGYGVSLMNDCKYGYSCNGNQLSITLIKSGIWPHISDQGNHRFVYSIYPHDGKYSKGGTVKRAYELNQPMFICRPKRNDCHQLGNINLIKSTSSNIIIDTVKKAEDNNDIIVRMYESAGEVAGFNVEYGFSVSRVFITDILENNLKEVDVKDRQSELTAKPFEIITLRIIR